MKQVLIIVQKNAFCKNNNFLITAYTGLSRFRSSESLISQKSKVIEFSFNQWLKRIIEWSAYFFEYYYR